LIGEVKKFEEEVEEVEENIFQGILKMLLKTN
jgi:hypothetical protein